MFTGGKLSSRWIHLVFTRLTFTLITIIKMNGMFLFQLTYFRTILNQPKKARLEHYGFL